MNMSTSVSRNMYVAPQQLENPSATNSQVKNRNNAALVKLLSTIKNTANQRLLPRAKYHQSQVGGKSIPFCELFNSARKAGYQQQADITKGEKYLRNNGYTADGQRPAKIARMSPATGRGMAAIMRDLTHPMNVSLNNNALPQGRALSAPQTNNSSDDYDDLDLSLFAYPATENKENINNASVDTNDAATVPPAALDQQAKPIKGILVNKATQPPSAPKTVTFAIPLSDINQNVEAITDGIADVNATSAHPLQE